MSEHQIPSADTTIFAVESTGDEPALLFVNGAFATVAAWKPVISLLNGKYRTVRFDGRARGKSGKSADYTVKGAVDDIGAVIEATGLKKPIIVGWSYGATTAVRYTSVNPEKVGGLVIVDGAYPIQAFVDDERREHVRGQFRRLAPMIRLAGLLGLSARMSAKETAEALIDMDLTNGTLLPDYQSLQVPANMILATGGHSGAPAEEIDALRDQTRELLKDIEKLNFFATVPVNHVQVVPKAPQTVVDAIEDMVARVKQG